VSGNVTGASNHRAAVEQFFAAIKAGDIQATSTVWGDARGAARDYMGREQLEVRILTMQCWLAHDAMRIVGTPRTKADSAVYRVELVKSGGAQQTDVVTVSDRRSRWFVSDPRVTGLVAPGCR
jgi:hypothetical protein